MRRSRHAVATASFRYCAALCTSVALLAGTIGLALTAHAEDGEALQTRDDKARIAALRAKIDELSGSLRQQRIERARLERALRPIEQRIAEQSRKARAARHALARAERSLAQLSRREQQQVAALRAQRHALGREIRQAYMHGRQGTLKLMLNLDDPAQFERQITYYRYIASARKNRIEQHNRSLTRLAAAHRRIETSIRDLARASRANAREHTTLRQLRRARRAILDTLNAAIVDKTRELARLREAERALDGIVEQAGRTPVRPGAPLTTHFDRRTGRLPMPVKGRIAVHFGEPRPVGGLKWKGIFIATAEGEPVNAIHAGRVVYAEHLSGYGLLLIIDHGDGYMTLYGNNESLIVRRGDEVKANQHIAITGSTANPFMPGLYFELRRKGVAINPLRWRR